MTIDGEALVFEAGTVRHVYQRGDVDQVVFRRRYLWLRGFSVVLRDGHVPGTWFAPTSAAWSMFSGDWQGAIDTFARLGWPPVTTN